MYMRYNYETVVQIDNIALYKNIGRVGCCGMTDERYMCEGVYSNFENRKKESKQSYSSCAGDGGVRDWEIASAGVLGERELDESS